MLIACKLGQWDLVNLLLFYNADVNVGPKPEEKRKDNEREEVKQKKNKKTGGDEQDAMNEEVRKVHF